MQRSASAPLRRSRYSSVLESALVGLGREDAVVQSTRKPRRKRRYEESESPIKQPFSAPQLTRQEEEEDPFAHLKLLKHHKKKKKKKNNEDHREEQDEETSPAVTRSAAKKKHKRRRHAGGVLEMAGRTPVTRSMLKKKKWKRSSLEVIEDTTFKQEEEEEEEEVVIQKKLFQSPERKKKKAKEEKDGTRGVRNGGRVNRKAVVLKHWRVEWPPVLESDSDRVEMVLTGHVDGEPVRFAVGKREGSTRFTSKEGGYVALAGKFDRDAARSAGIPRAAMELMEEGIPAYFYKRLLPFVRKTQAAGKQKARSKLRSTTKKVEMYSSPIPSIDEDAGLSTEAPIVSTPTQDDDTFATPKPKKTRAAASAKEKKKTAKKNQPESEPEAEVDVWTNEQLEALIDAKLQVAQYVPGKSATDCQTKTFEQFRSPPTNRKPAKKPTKRTNPDATSAIPTKIARAGSNKFKKQVREFVEEYEKKHVDDLFETTPSKEGLPELPEFDAIKSPELATPSRSFDEDDSEMDDRSPGLLKKLSSRRRDDIDSYVLGINRQHVAGGGVMAGGKVRRVTSMVTPDKAKAMSAKKKAVMLTAEVGAHSLKGVVSPGGTTHVRIEKDGSSSEDEDDYHSSEEEENVNFV